MKNSSLPFTLSLVAVSAISVDRHASRTPDPDLVKGLRLALENNGGFAQPPVVYPDGPTGGYKVKHGNARVLAATGVLDELPVLVTEPPASSSLNLLDQFAANMLQSTVSPLDIGLALRRLQRDEGFTAPGLRDLLAEKGVVRSIGWVHSHLALVRMDPEVQRAVANGELSAHHAHLLGGMDAADQVDWAARITREGWSVRMAREAIELTREPADQPAVEAPAARVSWADREINRLVADITNRRSARRPVVGLTPADQPAVLATRWSATPVSPAMVDGGGLSNAAWAASAPREAVGLAREASAAGYGDDAARRMAEGAIREAATFPEDPVRHLVEALREALEQPRAFARCPALTELAAIRMKNWMATLAADHAGR
ncbi:MAG: ParB/RepB/Spo0J family partition protein [Chloroflexota bacterium]